jgi:hypothetical protein
MEALGTLPTDMPSAYTRTLDRIEAARRTTVIKVLSWLFYARRPLHKDELREAISVRVGRTTLPKPLVYSDALVQYCQGLIIVDESSGIARFTHFTVQEFLEKHYKEKLLTVVDLARVCLTYLTFDVFECGACPDKNAYRQRMQDYRFSEYAVQYCGGYLRGPAESDDIVLDGLCNFLGSVQKRVAMYQIQLFIQAERWEKNAIFELSGSDLTAWTPLHMLARDGLAAIYKRIATAENDASIWQSNQAALGKKFRDIDLGTVHSKDKDGLTPLLEAAKNGHVITMLSVSNGADLHAQQWVDRIALWWT